MRTVAAIQFRNTANRADSISRNALGAHLGHVRCTGGHCGKNDGVGIDLAGYAFNALEHCIVESGRGRRRTVDVLRNDFHVRVINHLGQLRVEGLHVFVGKHANIQHRARLGRNYVLAKSRIDNGRHNRCPQNRIVIREILEEMLLDGIGFFRVIDVLVTESVFRFRDGRQTIKVSLSRSVQTHLGVPCVRPCYRACNRGNGIVSARDGPVPCRPPCDKGYASGHLLRRLHTDHFDALILENSATALGKAVLRIYCVPVLLDHEVNADIRGALFS